MLLYYAMKFLKYLDRFQILSYVPRICIVFLEPIHTVLKKVVLTQKFTIIYNDINIEYYNN